MPNCANRVLFQGAQGAVATCGTAHLGPDETAGVEAAILARAKALAAANPTHHLTRARVPGRLVFPVYINVYVHVIMSGNTTTQGNIPDQWVFDQVGGALGRHAGRADVVTLAMS
jgi:hypothetical protein